MPVGFYYKTFIRPRFAWEVAERVIRRATGLGKLPVVERCLADRRPTRADGCAGRGRRGGRTPGRAGCGRWGPARDHLRRVDHRRGDRAWSGARPGTRTGGRGPRQVGDHRARGPRRHRDLRRARGAARIRGRVRARASRTRRGRHRRGGDPPDLPGQRPPRRVARPRRRAHGGRPRGSPGRGGRRRGRNR